MVNDLQVRAIEDGPAPEVHRSANWIVVAKWASIGIAIVLALALVWFLAWGHTWYNNRQITGYLKAHGVVTAPFATVPGPVNALSTDASGNVYALSASHRVVTVLHSDGTRSVVHIPVATSGGTKIIGGLGGEALNGMVTLPDGTTFIADEWRLAIIRIAPNGAVNMNWAFVSNPISALYSDAHGNLYSPDSGLTRVGANGSVTPNWLNAKQLPSGASPYSIAVSPGGTVFISRSDGFNADLFEVQSDHTLVRVATVKIGSFSLKVPPSIDFASSAFSVSASKALWALGQGAVGLVLPTGQVSTWWLTDSHGSVASTRAPFAVAANHTGYAVLDAGKATGAATTIVRFTLPTTQ